MISFSTKTKVISFLSKFKTSSILRKEVRVVTLVLVKKTRKWKPYYKVDFVPYLNKIHYFVKLIFDVFIEKTENH